jgi:flagellar biosynthesis/type III secretory pathway chaperone
MIVAVIVLIALIALYRWSITPHLQYLLAADKYGIVTKEIEKTTKNIDKELQISRRRLDEISEQFRQEKQEFFEIDAAKSFLENLQSTVEGKRCFVETLKFLPAKQITVEDGNSLDIQQYHVNLAVSGRYQDITELLDSLQNRKQKVWIDTINLHLKDQAADYLLCDMSLSIYVLKGKEI